MSAIYDAISDLMDSCVKELRKSNKIDTSELTLEHGLFKSFDDIVRRQLDSVWHTVSPKTKQVCSHLPRNVSLCLALCEGVSPLMQHQSGHESVIAMMYGCLDD